MLMAAMRFIENLLSFRALVNGTLTLAVYRGNGQIVGKPEVIRFIRHAARWRRFFRSLLREAGFTREELIPFLEGK